METAKIIYQKVLQYLIIYASRKVNTPSQAVSEKKSKLCLGWHHIQNSLENPNLTNTQ